MELNERGILDRYQVELIGAKAQSDPSAPKTVTCSRSHAQDRA
jgi:hypothetical protein